MWHWLSNIFSPVPTQTMTQMEVKRLFCVPELVDNPALLHVSSPLFIVPSRREVERKVDQFRAGASYSEHFRCIHFARRLAAHLAGTGWAVGLLTVDTGAANAHSLVSVVADDCVLYFDAETRREESRNFRIIWGEIA